MVRVELHLLEGGVVRKQAWATGSPAGSRYRRITVGRLPDGRWFAQHTGKGPAYVVADRPAAYDLANRWLSDGRSWRPTPAAFDARHEPVDTTHRWYRSGGDWHAEPDGDGAAELRQHA